MKRPDLSQQGKYDGWQVLDPTPQEMSGGVYCCGPAPVLAIREGAVNLKFDAPFIFAEVNADVVHWLLKARGPKSQIFRETEMIGQNISTKAINSNKREDITHTYKHKEGSKLERVAFKRAVDGGFGGDDSRGNSPDKPTPHNVEIEIEEMSESINGKDIELKVKFSSKDRQARNLNIHITTQAMMYTGQPAFQVNSDVRNETLQPSEVLTLHLAIPYRVYGKHMLDCDSLKVSVMAKDEPASEDDDVYMAEKDITLKDPPITLSVLGEAQQYFPLSVLVVFKNPLDQKLTNCSLTVTGSGLLPHDVESRLPDLEPRHQLKSTIQLVPYRSGVKTLVVDLDCSAFRDIKASCEIDVKSYHRDNLTYRQTDRQTNSR